MSSTKLATCLTKNVCLEKDLNEHHQKAKHHLQGGIWTDGFVSQVGEGTASFVKDEQIVVKSIWRVCYLQDRYNGLRYTKNLQKASGITLAVKELMQTLFTGTFC